MSYQTFYQKITAPFKTRGRLVKAIAVFERVLVLFCASLFFFSFLTRILTPNFDPLRLVLTVGCPACCLALASVLRLIFKRPRPYEKEGAGIEPLQEKPSKGNSMPSRHVSCAAVIATVSLSIYVWAGVLGYVLCALIACIRCLLGYHYPTDLVAGLLLGMACGLPVFFV